MPRPLASGGGIMLVPGQGATSLVASTHSSCDFLLRAWLHSAGHVVCHTLWTVLRELDPLTWSFDATHMTMSAVSVGCQHSSSVLRTNHQLTPTHSLPVSALCFSAITRSRTCLSSSRSCCTKITTLYIFKVLIPSREDTYHFSQDVR